LACDTPPAGTRDNLRPPCASAPSVPEYVAAQAIHANNVGASIEQRFRSIGRIRAFGGLILILETDGDHRRQTRSLGALHGNQRFTQPGKCFPNNEVDAFVHLHGKLFVESLAHAIGGGWTARLVHPRQANVAGNQTLVARNLLRDANRRAIEFLQTVLEPNRRQLVAARIKSQRLQHLGASFAKFNVELS
jgi:hypothetical protein